MGEYEVRLINTEGCTFDEQAGFENVEDALAWASYRGSEYTINILSSDRNECYTIPVSVSDEKFHFTVEILRKFSSKRNYITMTADNYEKFLKPLFLWWNDGGYTGLKAIYDGLESYSTLMKQEQMKQEQDTNVERMKPMKIRR